MSAPNIYWIGQLARMTKEVQTEHPTIGWVPARPMGWPGLALGTRLKAAWLVFTGQADAVKWYE